MKERNSSIELLRILSMLMVLTLHYLNFGGFLGNVYPSDRNYYLVWMLEGFSLVAVNCYVLISGYFMVTAKFKWSRIIRTWAIVWIYSIGIYLICVVIGFTEYQKQDFLYSLFPVFTKQFWFVNNYLILMAVSPLLNWLIQRISFRQMTAICILLVLISSFGEIVFSLMDYFAGHPEREIKYLAYHPAWFFCLYFFAAYLRLYQKGIQKSWIYLFGYVISMLVTVGLKLYYQQIDWTLSEMFYRYNFPLVLCSSICLFLFFTHLKIKNTFVNQWLPKVSGLTFSTYIVHQHLCLYIRLWKDIFQAECYYTSPFLVFHWLFAVLATLTICIAVDWVRNLIFQMAELNVKRVWNKIKQL